VEPGKTIAMQQLGKHVPAAIEYARTIEEILEVVFSLLSLRKSALLRMVVSNQS
jgi:hypothetical protein